MNLFRYFRLVLIVIALAACAGPATPVARQMGTPQPANPAIPPQAGPSSAIPTALPRPSPVSTAAAPVDVDGPARLRRAIVAVTPIPTGAKPGKPLAVPPPGDPPPAGAFIDAPDRDLYRLAAQLVPGISQDFPKVAGLGPGNPPEAGRIDTFSLLDLPALKIYRSDFKLRLVSEHAYWYVETASGGSVRQQDLERAATVFEEDIYPRITRAFGKEWTPGVDNDPHLNILNARLQGVGGYFTSTDEYPQSVFPFSNQREIIYVNSASYGVGTPIYLRTLAHELQHAIHWNADASEDTWVNEGLAELAATLAGYSQDSIHQFLGGRPTSLLHWPMSSSGAAANYGAASLFMHYLSEHYSNSNDLRLLLEAPEDGIAGIDAYLEVMGYQKRFIDIFQDWSIANLLDEPQGIYSYGNLDVAVRVHKFIDEYSEFNSEIPQYSTEYVELASFSGPLLLRFEGRPENSLLPIDAGPEGCWWSNSGDSIDSTLTRSLDLGGLKTAALNYQVWYSLEDKWDYAYIQVSLDGGLTWKILETPHTSPENPVGNSFGMGYTGDSGGWTDESVDLTPYTGREIQLRFQYVTDDAINGAGLCFRQISVPQVSPGALEDGWRADGFVRVNNRLRQDYIVQVVEFGPENQVTAMQLDNDNSGEMEISAPENLDRLVVAVSAIAPKTRQPAPYTLTVGPGR